MISSTQYVGVIAVLVAVTVCSVSMYDNYSFFGYRIIPVHELSTNAADVESMLQLLRECDKMRAAAENSDVLGELLEGYNDTQLAQAWRQVPVLEAPQLPRLLSPSQLNESLTVTSRLVSLFDTYGIEYVISYGTLLGSYVAHSIMAWDDDVDLVIHVRYQPLLDQLVDSGIVLNKFGMAHKFQCLAWSNGKTVCEMPKNKFWLNESIWSTGYEWLHPFVDVITYDNSSSQVWMKNDAESVVMPIETFYPLQKRPLNGLWFNAPREPYAFLVSNYYIWGNNKTDRSFTCSWPTWNHWAEKEFNGWLKVPCKTVVPYYPFVRRYKTSSGETQEDLQLNNVTYYSIVTSETFKPEWSPEPHRLVWFHNWETEKGQAPASNSVIHSPLGKRHNGTQWQIV